MAPDSIRLTSTFATPFVRGLLVRDHRYSPEVTVSISVAEQLENCEWPHELF